MHKGMKENPVKSSQEGINKPWREISEETNLADTLILDFQPPELRKKLFLSFKPPSFWGFCYDSPSRLIQLLCTGALKLSAGLCDLPGGELKAVSLHRGHKGTSPSSGGIVKRQQVV